jgi:hypothetical protein
MRAIAAAAVLLTTACGQQLTADEVRQALPTPESVRIDAPNPGASSARTVPLRMASVAAIDPAQASPFAVTSYLFATSVNVGVGLTLLQLELVTLLPPTSCTTDACTWGPGSRASEPNDWMLVVTRDGDAFDYALSGRPKSDPLSAFVPVITGTAFPGATRGRGHGQFVMHFDDAWAGLDHTAGELLDGQQAFGTLTATYDARAALEVGVTFLGGRNDDDPGADPANPNRANAVYDFQAGADGGRLQIGWRTVPPFGAGTIAEDISLNTRWNAAGFGRGDFAYHNQNLTWQASQCWDGAVGQYLMSYDSTVIPAAGDEAACAFSPAQFISLDIP